MKNETKCGRGFHRGVGLEAQRIRDGHGSPPAVAGSYLDHVVQAATAFLAGAKATAQRVTGSCSACGSQLILILLVALAAYGCAEPETQVVWPDGVYIPVAHDPDNGLIGADNFEVCDVIGRALCSVDCYDDAGIECRLQWQVECCDSATPHILCKGVIRAASESWWYDTWERCFDQAAEAVLECTGDRPEVPEACAALLPFSEVTR